MPRGRKSKGRKSKSTQGRSQSTKVNENLGTENQDEVFYSEIGGMGGKKSDLDEETRGF